MKCGGKKKGKGGYGKGKRKVMWSCYIYWGLNLGFEFYEAELEYEDGSKDQVEYFLINIGPIRIQRGEYI